MMWSRNLMFSFFNFDVSLTMMGSSFLEHYMRYLHKCKTTNTYIAHMHLHKNECHILHITHIGGFFFLSIALLSHDSF